MEAFCRREGFPLTGDCRVLCAVSGGIDSMALLDLLWQRSRTVGFWLAAATFDHQLRDSSAEDVRFVQDWCQARGVPCLTGSGQVAAFARAEGLTLEEAGRELRYQFLTRQAETLGADYIATAHNADDNGETVLLHLLRGSGLRGLGGIPPRRGKIVRPLLEVTREEIEAYALERRLPHREDESNRDTAYTRNFLRHRVLPLLRERNPSVTLALGRAAESLRQDEECLSQLAEERARDLLVREEDGVSVSVAALLEQPAAIALRLVQRMAEWTEPGTVLPQNQRAGLLELARKESPSGKIFLTNQLQASRVYGMLTLSHTQPESSGFLPVALGPGETVSIPELGLTVSCRQVRCPEPACRKPGTLYLRPGTSGFVRVRPRQTGDEIDLPGRGRKRLKKWFIEEKVPRARRALLPVLEIDGQVAAVAGLGCGARWTARPGEPAWQIILQSE